MYTKADFKIKAAELAIESGYKNFTSKAEEIYDFLCEGLDIPDNPNYMEDVIENMKKIWTPNTTTNDCISSISTNTDDSSNDYDKERLSQSLW